MEEITADQLEEIDSFFLYIHTPFCGTCHIARSFLETIEKTHKRTIFYELNASLFPNFMQKYKIESVPCLFIKQDGEVREKIYTFHSIPNMYHYLFKYAPNLFISE